MADHILLVQTDNPAELEDDLNHYHNTPHVHRISD